MNICKECVHNEDCEDRIRKDDCPNYEPFLDFQADAEEEIELVKNGYYGDYYG